jgi:hypothetical protein
MPAQAPIPTQEQTVAMQFGVFLD